MPRKAQRAQKSESPVIVMTETDDGKIKLMAARNFQLPCRRISGLTRFGYICNSLSGDRRAAFITLPRGKSWESCRDQVIGVLRCREFIIGLENQGYIRPLVIHDNVRNERALVVALTRQSQLPRRRRPRTRKNRARAA